jgi:hypothetical protein
MTKYGDTEISIKSLNMKQVFFSHSDAEEDNLYGTSI